METSDSEYFESADEEFYSDSEDEITQKVTEKTILNTNENFKKLTISGNEKELDSLKNDRTEKEHYQDTDKNILKTGLEKSKDIPNEKDYISKESKEGQKKDVSFKSSSVVKNNIDVEQSDKKKLYPEKINPAEDSPITEKETNKNNIFEGDGWDVDEEDMNLWKDDEIQWPSDKPIDLKNKTDEQPFNIKENHSKVNRTNDDIKKDNLDINNENMWEIEQWEDFEDMPGNNNKQHMKNEADSSWTGWGNWGVSSILNTATQSVSSITNQVSQGLSSVLETGIGIPNAEELAKIHLEEEKQFSNSEETPQKTVEDSSAFGFGNLGNFVSGVSNLTKFVESTSTKVIAGGLDTLETIGKKTMEVLQEGDPGLKKKRAFLKLDQEKPILSQILREAKEKAERENMNKNYSMEVVKKLNYETIFDDHHGLVHLEALEMLSKQCDIRLKTLIANSSDTDLTDLQETMDQVKELCELPDEDEEEQLSTQQFREKLQAAMQDIKVNITYEKLLSTWEDTEQWLNNLKLNICDEQELHQQAIETLAQLTALAVEQYHKAGELLLVKEHRSTADEADSLVQLTSTLTSLIGAVAAKFSDKLNSKLAQGSSDQESINGLITNVFFEAANSSSYIQDAFQLLIPVIQIGAV